MLSHFLAVLAVTINPLGAVAFMLTGQAHLAELVFAHPLIPFL